MKTLLQKINKYLEQSVINNSGIFWICGWLDRNVGPKLIKISDLFFKK